MKLFRTTAFTLVQTSIYYITYIATRNSYNFVKKLFYCDENEVNSGVYNLNAFNDAFWLSALYSNVFTATSKLGVQDVSVKFVLDSLALTGQANQLVLDSVSSSARKFAVTASFNSMLIVHDFLVDESSLENSFIRVSRIPVKYSAIIGCKMLMFGYLGEGISFSAETSSNIFCNFVGEVTEGVYKATATYIVNSFITSMKVKEYKASEFVSDVAVATHKEFQKNLEKSVNNYLVKSASEYSETTEVTLEVFPFHYIAGGLLRHYSYSAYAALSKYLIDEKKDVVEVPFESFEKKSRAPTYENILLIDWEEKEYWQCSIDMSVQCASEVLSRSSLDESLEISCFDNGSQCILGVVDPSFREVFFSETVSAVGYMLF